MMIDDTSAATAQSHAPTTAASSIIILERVLDEKSADVLMNRVREMAKQGLAYIIFDCKNLEYITSFGLSVFLRARKLMREKFGDSTEVPLKVTPETGETNTTNSDEIIDPGSTRIRLAGVQPNVMGILRTACLLQILPVYRDVDTAGEDLK